MKKRVCFLLACVFAAALLCGCGHSPKGKVQELEELKGRVVYSIGKGNVPDLVFRYLLKSAGVSYRYSDEAKEGTVSLAYVSEGTEIVGGLAAGKINYGVLGEPAATTALKKVQGTERMLDLQQLYNKVTDTAGGYPQAVLAVKTKFLQDHPGYVTQFVASLQANAKWAETNTQEAVAAIKGVYTQTSVASLTQESAKGCNIAFTSALDAKVELLAFFRALDSVKEEGETPIGNGLPDDTFFAAVPQGESEQNVTANVYAPDGAPAVGLSKPIADGFAGATFHIVPPADIGGYVLKGTADLAILPSNAAANLYGKGAGIQVLGVINHGNLFMVGKV